MPDDPLRDAIAEPVSNTLEYNLARLKEKLRAGRNTDVTARRIVFAGRGAAAFFLDGMADAKFVSQHVLRPLLEAAPCAAENENLAEYAAGEVLSSCALKPAEKLDEVMSAVLGGDTALFFDGCAEALVIDTKGFVKRGVDQPVSETTVIGAHEAFVESLKSNLTLLRRGVRSPRFVAEIVEVGTGAPQSAALIYLDGVCNEQIVSEARRRMTHIEMDHVSNLEMLEQLLEDSPYSIFPQFAHTERPCPRMGKGEAG